MQSRAPETPLSPPGREPSSQNAPAHVASAEGTPTLASPPQASAPLASPPRPPPPKTHQVGAPRAGTRPTKTSPRPHSPPGTTPTPTPRPRRCGMSSPSPGRSSVTNPTCRTPEPGSPPRSRTGRSWSSAPRTAAWPPTSTCAATAERAWSPTPNRPARRSAARTTAGRTDSTEAWSEPRRLGRSLPRQARLGLFPARVESFLGFVFVNLDLDAVPLAEQCAGLAEAVGHYAGADLVPVGRDRIHDLAGAEVQDANWKVAVDNYLEGYHVPVAHPGLMRLLDYQGYSCEIEESYVLFTSPLRDKPSSNWAERLYQRIAAPMPGLGEADRRVWRYAVIYPNTLIDFYPDHVLAWTAIPTATERVAVPGGFYTRRGTSLRTRLARRLNIHIGWITNDEDAELVARVQQGLSTPGFEPGPLSRRESAVGWFAERIRADLDAADG